MKWKYCLLAILLCATAADALRATAQIVARLSEIHGEVFVVHGHRPSRRVLMSALLQAGDLVALHSGASANLLLTRSRARYGLTAGSRVRVSAARLTRIAGPLPVPARTGAAPGASSPLLDRRGLGHLAPSGRPPPAIHANREPNRSSELLDARGMGDTVRLMGGDARFGPREPRPLFAVRDWDGILRWSGPVDPLTQQEGGLTLHLRIQTLDRAVTLWSSTIKPELTEIHVPSGKVRPGGWYLWSVTAETARGSGQACGGPLRLLTGGERSNLGAAERKAGEERKAHPGDPGADRRLGGIYERLGMVREAIASYEAAQKIQPDSQVARALARLGKLVNGR